VVIDEGLIKSLDEKEMNLLKNINKNKIVDPKMLTLAISLKKQGLITIEYVKKELMRTDIVAKLTLLGKLNLAYGE